MIKRSALILLVMMFCSAASAESEKTWILKDQVGREVTLPRQPARVIALAPSITEIVYALGRENTLVGATIYSDYPEEANKLPRVGSYIHLDLEKIVALKPDLCIAVKDGNPKETVLRIEKLGIPVFAVNPDGFDSVITAVDKIGEILGATKKATAIVTDMTKRMKKVTSFTSSIADKPGVFFQIGISPIVSTGSGTFLHELIELSGGKNLAAGSKSYPRFSKEQVLAMNPDVIIITSMARSEIFQQVKNDWESWQDLAAVKKNRVHIVNSDILDRPTPRLVDGLEMLTAVIHPEFKY